MHTAQCCLCEKFGPHVGGIIYGFRVIKTVNKAFVVGVIKGDNIFTFFLDNLPFENKHKNYYKPNMRKNKVQQENLLLQNQCRF